MKHAPRSRLWSPPHSAFAGFRFPAEVIVVAVRWYLRYGLSYRDVEELLAEPGVEVDHVTVYRWVQRFTPLLADAARFARHAPGERWFVNETYVGSSPARSSVNPFASPRTMSPRSTPLAPSLPPAADHDDDPSSACGPTTCHHRRSRGFMHTAMTPNPMGAHHGMDRTTRYPLAGPVPQRRRHRRHR